MINPEIALTPEMHKELEATVDSRMKDIGRMKHSEVALRLIPEQLNARDSLMEFVEKSNEANPFLPKPKNLQDFILATTPLNCLAYMLKALFFFGYTQEEIKKLTNAFNTVYSKTSEVDIQSFLPDEIRHDVFGPSYKPMAMYEVESNGSLIGFLGMVSNERDIITNLLFNLLDVKLEDLITDLTPILEEVDKGLEAYTLIPFNKHLEKIDNKPYRITSHDFHGQSWAREFIRYDVIQDPEADYGDHQTFVMNTQSLELNTSTFNPQRDLNKAYFESFVNNHNQYYGVDSPYLNCVIPAVAQSYHHNYTEFTYSGLNKNKFYHFLAEHHRAVVEYQPDPVGDNNAVSTMFLEPPKKLKDLGFGLTATNICGKIIQRMESIIKLGDNRLVCTIYRLEDGAYNYSFNTVTSHNVLSNRRSNQGFYPYNTSPLEMLRSGTMAAMWGDIPSNRNVIFGPNCDKEEHQKYLLTVAKSILSVEF